MWLLKSPIDGKPVDFDDFIKEDLKRKHPLHNARVIYEKLSYMNQLDIALLLIADVINGMDNITLYYPKKIYTLSQKEIEVLFNNTNVMEKVDEAGNISIIKDYMNGVSDFMNAVADKVKYHETYISDIFNKDITQVTVYSWRYFEPDFTIKKFCSENIKYLKSIELKKIKKEYENISNEIYRRQNKLARTIFYETDEYDKTGLFNIYKCFLSFFLHQKRELISLFKNSECYKQLLKLYPLIENDIDILFVHDYINNKKPYMTVNNDFTLKWNTDSYSISCFGNYFHFLNNNKEKSINWDKLKKIFPQFKNINISNNCRDKTSEIYILLSNAPSFKILNDKNEINSKFNKEDIKKINNLIISDHT